MGSAVFLKMAIFNIETRRQNNNVSWISDEVEGIVTGFKLMLAIPVDINTLNLFDRTLAFLGQHQIRQRRRTPRSTKRHGAL